MVRSTAQFRLDGVAFAHGPRQILADVTLTVGSGDRIGIVGPNGSGKSTLLRLMAGDLTPDAGTIATIPADATIGLVTQRLADLSGETVGELIERRAGLTAATAEFEAATIGLSDDAAAADSAERYDRALSRYLAVEPDTFAERVDQTLATVGLDAIGRDRACAGLSGGQRSRLNLAATLLDSNDLLLLDEPTNDLDTQGLALLEARFGAERPARSGQQIGPSGIVIVSHDRAFLTATTNAIVEIDAHHNTISRYDGGFEAWQQERAVAREHHEQAYANFTTERDRLKARAQTQRQWSDKGVKRVKASDESDKFVRNWATEGSENLAGKAKATERAIERLDVVEKPWVPWVLRLRFAEAERASGRVAELAGATVRRGEFVLGPPGDEINCTVTWGDRIIITGANGSGKSTLLAALLGEIALENGQQHLARSVRIGRLTQERLSSDESAIAEAGTLLDGFTAYTGLAYPEARSQLAKLGLDSERIARPSRSLSPGEQTRAMLGAFAATGRNLLVFDEPTNHLDLEAIEELEIALNAFGGTVLLVSHDRRLLESVNATRHFTVENGVLSGQ